MVKHFLNLNLTLPLMAVIGSFYPTHRRKRAESVSGRGGGFEVLVATAKMHVAHSISIVSIRLFCYSFSNILYFESSLMDNIVTNN